MADNIDVNVDLNVRSLGAASAMQQMAALTRATSMTNAEFQKQIGLGKPLNHNFTLTGRSAQTAARATQVLGTNLRNTGVQLRDTATATRNNTENLYEGVWMQRQYAATLLTVSAALTAVGAATVASFAQQERAFTSVERILMGDLLYQFGNSQEEAAVKVEALRDQLYDLSEQIPVTFSELSEIAAFGAALDIGNEHLDEFASTVARITAMVGGDAEQIGKSLARIAQYTGYTEVQDGFEKLGSAIVFAGNTSIATEQDVLKFAQAMAPLGRLADVSAGSIIGLAASTASFASINVEGAGSAMTRVFANIDRQVGSTGDNLAALAQISGHSADAFAQAWQGGGQEDLFFDILRGLNGEIDNLNLNMDALGIRNVRDRRVIQALAINYDFLADAVGNANRMLEEGTFLADSYAYFEDDLLSQWEVFQNLVSNTAGVVGQALAPAFAQALRTVNDLVSGFKNFAEANPWFVQLLGTVGALVAVWTAWRGITALVTSQMMAFRAATAWIGGGSLAAGAAGLQRTILGVGTASTVAAGQVSALGAANAATAASGSRLRRGLAGVVGFVGGPFGLAFTVAAGLVANAFSDMEARATEARGRITDALTGMRQDARVILDSIADSTDREWFQKSVFDGTAFTSAEEAMKGLEVVAGRVGEAMSFIDERSFWLPNAGVQELSDSFGLTWREALSLRKALDEAGAAINGLDAQEAAGALRAFGEATDSTSSDLYAFAKESAPDALQAIIDYGRELEITGSEQAIFNEVVKQAEAAQKAGAEGTDIHTAALALQEEQAEATKNAMEEALEALRNFQTPERMRRDAEFAFQENLEGAREAIDAFLESGQSLSDWDGIDFSNLSSEARDLITELDKLGAAPRETAIAWQQSGASLEDATGKFFSQRQEMESLLETLGLAPEAIQRFVDDSYGSMDELLAILGEVYGQASMIDGQYVSMTVDGDIDGWIETNLNVEEDIAELSATSAIVDINGNPVGFNTDASTTEGKIAFLNGKWVTIDMNGNVKDFDAKNNYVYREVTLANGQKVLIPYDADVDEFKKNNRYVLETTRNVNGTRVKINYDVVISTTGDQTLIPRNPDGSRSGNRVITPGFAAGGYTGKGAKYQPAGIVHKGEYVIPKHMVNQSTGLPYADALGRLQKGSSGPGYANGGYVRGADSSFPSAIALTPGTVQQIAAAVQHLVVLDRKDVTRAVNQQNYDFNQIGAY